MRIWVGFYLPKTNQYISTRLLLSTLINVIGLSKSTSVYIIIITSATVTMFCGVFRSMFIINLKLVNASL